MMEEMALWWKSIIYAIFLRQLDRPAGGKYDGGNDLRGGKQDVNGAPRIGCTDTFTSFVNACRSVFFSERCTI